MGPPTPAVAALVRAGVFHREHRYADPQAESSAEVAAATLGIDRARLFKTLVISAGDNLALAVVPSTAELDFKVLASFLRVKKAEMADRRVAERATGYRIGTISPVGSKRRFPVVMDASASTWDTIFVSGGRRGFELELRPDDLVRLTGARLATIAQSR